MVDKPQINEILPEQQQCIDDVALRVASIDFENTPVSERRDDETLSERLKKFERHTQNLKGIIARAVRTGGESALKQFERTAEDSEAASIPRRYR